MIKSYLVDLVLFQKKAFFHLQKFLLDEFLPNISIWSGILIVACMQKIKIGHHAKFRNKNKIMFPTAFISSLYDFMLHFHFRCYTCAAYDRHFDPFSWCVNHSYGVGRLRAHTRLETLSSLLTLFSVIFLYFSSIIMGHANVSAGHLSEFIFQVERAWSFDSCTSSCRRESS